MQRELKSLTDKEISQWWYLGNQMSEIVSLKRDPSVLAKLQSQLTAVKREIGAHIVEPYSALISAMKRNHVLMFGERHFSDNPQRWLLARSISDLRVAGATHFAIEQSISTQPQLDKFMQSGELNPNILPESIRSEDTLAVLNAARNAGLKIVATDLDKQIKNAAASSLSTADYNAYRDKFIAEQVSKILSSDPNDKVIWHGGNAHGNKHKAENKCGIERAANILQKTYSVFSVRDVPRGWPNALIFDNYLKELEQEHDTNTLTSTTDKKLARHCIPARI